MVILGKLLAQTIAALLPTFVEIFTKWQARRAASAQHAANEDRIAAAFKPEEKR